MTTTQPPIVLIQSAAQGNKAFGTGFIFQHSDEHTYILTCAHVVRDVGGTQSVLVNQQPATVVALGEDNALDLAVLQIPPLANRPPLRLQATDHEQFAVVIEGYYKHATFRPLEQINGECTKTFQLSDSQAKHYVQGWYIAIHEQDKLVGGYSGSPVIDVATGTVAALMITSEGERQGRAISIAALPHIWPEMPANLIQQPPPPSREKIFLAAHQDIRAASGGRSDEQTIDLMPFFTEDDPAPPIWNDSIIPQFEKQRIRLCANQQATLELRAFARNSVGVAFGFVFRKKAGFQLVYTDNYGAIWDSTNPLTVASPLECTHSVSTAGVAMKETFQPKPANGAQLRELLTTYFNDGELRTLCFDLEIEYESLPGHGKADKARELVAYVRRHRRESELLLECQRLRPNVDWYSRPAKRAPASGELAEETATDLIIELAVTQHLPQVQGPVDIWLNNRPIHNRVTLALKRDPLTVTPAEGLAIAQQVCGIIGKDKHPNGTTHLFGALPFGVALFIGWYAQAFGKLQCYERHPQEGHYQPTYLLRSF